MKIYQIPVVIHATAYVMAVSDEAAREVLKIWHNDFMEVSTECEPFCALGFDDPDLPSFSLSPPLTLHTYPGPDDLDVVGETD